MAEKTPPTPLPEKKKGISCWTLLGGFLLGLVLLFLLALAGVAAAISATGLIEVPVLSRVFKEPALTEDFSYQTVPAASLDEKIAAVESATGKVDITLTDDEFNTLFGDLFRGTADSPLRDLVVKFSAGVVKIKGTVSLPGMEATQDSTLYLELELAKSPTVFVFEIREARLGALPLPGFLIEGLVGQLAGTGQLLGKPTADLLPADEITVQDGSITIRGLDLSGLMPPEE